MKYGVMLPISTQSSLDRAHTYKELKGFAQQIESVGLDSIWLPDHLIYRFPEKPQGGVWEAWTLTTALAVATEKVEIGNLVLCTAFRNPAVLAKMAVALAEISEGRFILGLGAGWHEPEFTAFDLPFDHLAGRFEDALRIIVPLVKTGKVDYTGEYFSAPNCEMDPPRSFDIPVLIACKGPRMLKLTAEFADSWNTAWFGTLSAATPRIEALNAACTEVGRDPSTLEVTVGLKIAFPEIGELTEDERDPENYLSGSVEEVAAGLRTFADAGVGHVIVVLSGDTEKAITLFGKAAELARQ